MYRRCLRVAGKNTETGPSGISRRLGLARQERDQGRNPGFGQRCAECLALVRNSLRDVCARCVRTSRTTIALPDTDHRQEQGSFGRDHLDTMPGTREPSNGRMSDRVLAHIGAEGASMPTTVKVSNFGPIARGSVELRPLTVFFGPNNSGKTFPVYAHLWPSHNYKRIFSHTKIRRLASMDAALSGGGFVFPTFGGGYGPQSLRRECSDSFACNQIRQSPTGLSGPVA